MRTGLTLHVGDLRRDVEINAARGTTVGQVHAALAAADPAGVPSPGAWWAGTRAVAPAARIGQPGLRHGCVVGVNRPGPGAGGDPSTVLRLHVVGGPDAGAVLPLPREGSVVIGRGPDCSLQLSDPEVSRHHAEVRMTPSGLRVRDLGSTNGSALETPGGSAGAVSGQAVALAVAQRFTVGESVLCVAGAAAPPAMVTTDDDGRLMVNRPPRVLFPLSDRTVELPVPASSSARAALPWLAAALPAVAGVAVAWYVGNAQFLAFALLSPVMMLGSALGERLTGRRGRRRARGEFRRLEAARRDEVQHLLQSEITARHSARPDAAETAHIAGTPSARIWERRRGDADFLQVRLGLGPQDASLVVRRGTATEPPVRLDAVPIAVDLREPLGICGPAPVTRSLARWLLCQLATLHSPGDVTVVAVLTDAAATGWEWLRWLPHCPEAAAVARRDDQRRALVGRLLVQLDQRVAGAPVGAGRTEPRRDWTGPWTLVLLDRTSELADVTGLGRLLRDGRSVGFTALCLEDDSRRLPPWCGTVARTSGELGSRLDLSHPRGPSDILADQVTVQWAERTARGLAPLVDPGTDASAAVPRIARLGDILGGVDLLPEDVLLRWRSGDGRATSVLGLGAEAPLAVDLDRDGPHVLVAGTTGAGKSELLQTLVVGLAVHASPVDLQFVLVDYKGGAAFADCARLPHTAGLVTDLDAQLTQRALRSLNAELRRREELFASARVTDLAAYRRTPSHRAASVGRLVLVVDEFAALAVELPDFVDGLVSIAQRGRSLGVHLVLATQRPAGVVSAEIRANTALRIALRVTDPAESLDIIGTDVAATIDPALPGRAYVRTGQGLVEMQALHLGAAREDSSEVRVVTLDAWGHPGQTAFTGERSTGPTDLCEVVQAVRSAAQSGGFGAARRPWLPPLPTVLDAATLSSWPPTGRIPLGLMDRPDEQAQRPLEIDLEEGTALLLTGGPRSGRTNAVRLLATTAVGRLPADRLHLYVIDGSGGGLRALQDTPHCGAVVPGRDGPLAARLLQRLSDEVARRRAVMAELGAGTIAEGRACGAALPAVLLVVDDWEGFAAGAEDIDAAAPVDALLDLMREGPSAGVTVVITGGRATLSTRITGAATRRLVLRLDDSGDYAVAGLSRRDVPEDFTEGRAVDPAERVAVQLAVLGPEPSVAAQTAQMVEAVRRARAAGRGHDAMSPPMRLRPLPRCVTLESLPPAVAEGTAVLGVAGDVAAPVLIELANAGARMMIAGPPRSGRSTALLTLAVQLIGRGITVVLAGPRRSGLLLGTSSAVRVQPDAEPPPEVLAALRGSPLDGPPGRTVLLVDDFDCFTDTAAGDAIEEVIRAGRPGLGVVVAGRTEDFAVAYRGLGSIIRRGRSGLLLQPTPADGDLLGVRIPSRRDLSPPGRGLLVAPDVVVGRADGPSDLLTMNWADNAAGLSEPALAVQVARP